MTGCGHPGCRCHADPPQLHGPYHQWTRKINGKTATRILTDDQLADYGPWFSNHRRLRELIAELEELSLAIAEANPPLEPLATAPGAGTGPPGHGTGTAEQEQCFGEVDRPGVDGAEALVEHAGVAVRIIAGHVEKCLRDSQGGAQFVGGVAREPLLFDDVRFESCEHGVERVGEFAELIAAAR